MPARKASRPQQPRSTHLHNALFGRGAQDSGARVGLGDALGLAADNFADVAARAFDVGAAGDAPGIVVLGSAGAGGGRSGLLGAGGCSSAWVLGTRSNPTATCSAHLCHAEVPGPALVAFAGVDLDAFGLAVLQAGGGRAGGGRRGLEQRWGGAAMQWQHTRRRYAGALGEAVRTQKLLHRRPGGHLTRRHRPARRWAAAELSAPRPGGQAARGCRRALLLTWVRRCGACRQAGKQEEREQRAVDHPCGSSAAARNRAVAMPGAW